MSYAILDLPILIDKKMLIPLTLFLVDERKNSTLYTYISAIATGNGRVDQTIPWCQPLHMTNPEDDAQLNKKNGVVKTQSRSSPRSSAAGTVNSIYGASRVGAASVDPCWLFPLNSVAEPAAIGRALGVSGFVVEGLRINHVMFMHDVWVVDGASPSTRSSLSCVDV